MIGGALLDRYWWGSCFLVGVPAMAVPLVTGPILLPQNRNPKTGRLDPAGVALSLMAVLPTGRPRHYCGPTCRQRARRRRVAR